MDYESDYYAAALYNRELSGVEPIDLLAKKERLKLVNASLITDQYDGKKGILCVVQLNREGGVLRIFQSI